MVEKKSVTQICILYFFSMVLGFVLTTACDSGGDDGNGGNRGDGDGNEDGNGDGAGGGGYLIEAHLGGYLTGGDFECYVGRIDKGDPSAEDAEVTVNGSSIPLRPLLSNDDDAVFATASVEYEPDTEYTVEVKLQEMSAKCEFASPGASDINVTSPDDGSSVTAGDDLVVKWDLTGNEADKVNIRVYDEDSTVYEKELTGSDTSHTIPGSETSGWRDYYELTLTVDLGEFFYPFSGDMATAGSGTSMVLPGDALTLYMD